MLYIVATPIGNLEDITLRALRVLKEADFIAAEDTRHTVKLLNRYDIKTKLISFHEHSGEDKLGFIISLLKDKKNIALVSDAGTPLISDPGAELVLRAAAEGIEITSLPGACAAVAAVTLSGFSGPFTFIGFLPKKGMERRNALEGIARSVIPCVLYESPHSLSATLNDIAVCCGEKRIVAVAKELTKIHERVFRGTAAQAREAFGGENKGEYVVISGGREKEPDPSDEEIKETIEKYIDSGMTKKEAADAASKKLSIKKNRAYKLTISS